MTAPIHMSVAIGVLAVAVGAPTAAATTPSESFDGTCDLVLTVVHDPPLTASPTSGSARARGTGECTGSLTETGGHVVHLDGASAEIRAAGTGDLSCGGGQAQGEGVLFLPTARIRFAFQEVRGPGVATLHYVGTGGGDALGEAYAAPDQDPVQTVTACAETGLRRVRVLEHLVSNDLAG